MIIPLRGRFRNMFFVGNDGDQFPEFFRKGVQLHGFPLWLGVCIRTEKTGIYYSIFPIMKNPRINGIIRIENLYRIATGCDVFPFFPGIHFIQDNVGRRKIVLFS